MTLSARLSRYQLPLGGSVRTARAAWHERAGLIFTLEDSQGGFGQGEAAPLPGYSDESFEQAEQRLSRLDLGWLEAVLTKAVNEPQSLGPELARAVWADAPSAQFALETAAFAWLAQRRREPLHALLRYVFPESTFAPASLRLTALLDSDDPLASAERAVLGGFTTLKLKVGLEGGERAELALLRELGVRFERHVAIRLDANGAWSSTVARARLEAFADLGVEFIEEPTAATEVALVAPAVPVALDESLRRAPLPSKKELSERGVTALVFKPTVLGGIAKTLVWASAARRVACAAVVSHCFEGPIGYAALCELALALGSSSVAHGLGPHVGLDAWSARPSASPGQARLTPHATPGLGLGPEPIEPGPQ